MKREYKKINTKINKLITTSFEIGKDIDSCLEGDEENALFLIEVKKIMESAREKIFEAQYTLGGIYE